ncbi:16538_t:CDS:1, partial [Racocetra fulgida]
MASNLETPENFIFAFQKYLDKLQHLETDIRNQVNEEIINTRTSYDVEEEYTISSDDLNDYEFKNLRHEYNNLIRTFKSKSKDKETDFLFKTFYQVFDVFQENGYLKPRKYCYKFNIFKDATKVSFIPNNVKIKKIKIGDDDDIDSQINSIYGISRKEQPKSFDIIINAIEATDFFVNRVLVKSWKTLESYDESKTVKEIAELPDSNMNKIVLLLTESNYGNIINSYLEIPKLLFFAQLLFDNGLVFPIEITEESYSKFKKNVNKALREWESKIAELNLEKSGCTPETIDFKIAKREAINKVRKRLNLAVDLWLWCKTFGLIILAGNPNFGIDFWEKNLNKSNYFKMYELLSNSNRLKQDLKQQNDNFCLIIYQGLESYADHLNLNDKNLVKKLPIKPILFEVPVELFNQIKNEQVDESPFIISRDEVNAFSFNEAISGEGAYREVSATFNKSGNSSRSASFSDNSQMEIDAVLRNIHQQEMNITQKETIDYHRTYVDDPSTYTPSSAIQNMINDDDVTENMKAFIELRCKFYQQHAD